jgi:two-component system, NarL family, sensor histidine kinase UhpB
LAVHLLGNFFQVPGACTMGQTWNTPMSSAKPARAALGAAAPRLDLKSALTLRVIVVASACFLAAAAFAVYSTAREVRAGNANVADLVARQLQVQLFRIEANLEAPEQFPDWEPVIGYVQSAGQCIHFIRPDGSRRSGCTGASGNIGWLPDWLSDLSGWTGIARADVTRPISARGKIYGHLLVQMEPAVVLAMIWKDVSGLLGLTALLVCLTCLLQYVAIRRALQPTDDILAGLDRLAHGDLSCRLPDFRLIELQRISEVFNDLAVSLERTTRERSALAGRLVNGQEQERQHLARELHDELAQTLSAMNATAASIKLTAENECPALVAEAHKLSLLTMTVMRSLRTTLRALRPPEIDDLGLEACLRTLVSDHERRSGGTVKIALDLGADLKGLPPTTTAHLYRIVQEGLTNVSKHANASRANIALGFQAISGRQWLSLTIEDDGSGSTDHGATAESGLGLIGMKERAMALGGQLDIISGDRSFKLQAVIPIAPVGNAP